MEKIKKLIIVRYLATVGLSLLSIGCFNAETQPTYLPISTEKASGTTQVDNSAPEELVHSVSSQNLSKGKVLGLDKHSSLKIYEGELDGSTTVFPPGSLAVGTEIAMSSGHQMDSATLADQYSLEEAPVSTSTPLQVELSQPLPSGNALSITLPYTFEEANLWSLNFADTGRIVVSYRVVTSQGDIRIGILETSQLTIELGKISFEFESKQVLNKFIFQPVKLSPREPEMKKKESKIETLEPSVEPKEVSTEDSDDLTTEGTEDNNSNDGLDDESPSTAEANEEDNTPGTSGAPADPPVLGPAVLAMDNPTQWAPVVIGSSEIITFVLTNSGDSSATEYLATVDAPFSLVGGTCGSEIASGASCTVEVQFSPTATNAATKTLTITYSDGSTDQTLQKTLEGSGLNPAILSIDNPSQWAPEITGFESDITFTLTNSGGVAATGITPAVGSPFSVHGGTCTANLAAAASCTIIIRSLPTVAGAHTGNLEIDYNDGSGPATTVTKTLSATSTNINLAVTATFSIADKWLSWVMKNNPSSACDGTSECLHGGEHKTVIVPGLASCADLKMEDNLDAFSWVCDESTNPIQFKTKRLNLETKLEDLKIPLQMLGKITL